MDIYLTYLLVMDQASTTVSSNEKKYAAERGKSNDGQLEKRFKI